MKSDKKHTAFKMNDTENCLLCFNEIDEANKPNYSQKLSELCCKYLHSSFAQETLLDQSSRTDFSFCPKCLQSAENLFELNEQMESYQKRISELVFMFSLEILHRRGQTTVSKDKNVTTNAYSVKKLVKFDVSAFPNIKSWNNSFASENSVSQTKDSHVSENVYEETTVSEPLLIPVLPDNENSVVDKVKKIKCRKAELSHSIGKKLKGNAKGVSKDMVSTKKKLPSPTVKLQKLQFYDMEENVIDMGNGTENSIIANDQVRRKKFQTVWTRCNLRNSYRFFSMNKHLLPSETSSEDSEDSKSSKNFPISYTTENSVPVMHSGILELPYNCNFCERKFETLKLMLSHRRCHSWVNSCKFDECDVASDCRPKWKTHKLSVHLVKLNDKRHYSCNVCRKRFKLNYDLLSHYQTMHPGVRPYKCNFCDKRFGRPCNLKQHENIHAGENPYKCDFCDSRFTRKDKMLIHKRMHTGDKCT